MDKNETNKKAMLERTNLFLVKYFKYLNSVLIVLILVGGYFFIIREKIDEIENEEKSVKEEIEREYSEKERYLRDFLILKDIFEGIKPADKEKIKKVLPVGFSSENLLSKLEDMISKNGFILNSLEIKTASNKTSVRSAGEVMSEQKSDLPVEIGKMEVAMEIIGTDYVGLKSLLKSIENNLELMDVSKLSFSPGGNKTSLEISVYYLK